MGRLVADPGLGQRDLLEPPARPGLAGAGGHAQQRLDLGPPVQALLLDALAVAPQHAPAHVSIEGGALDAEPPGRLLDREVLLAVQDHHAFGLTLPAPWAAVQPRIARSILIKYNQLWQCEPSASDARGEPVKPS